MAEQRAIVPVEQRTIDFYGDELVAVRDEEGTVWVPIRPLCKTLGVSWPSQSNRIKRDPVLSHELRSVFVTNTNPQGGDPELSALPLKFVRAWLFGINASRVKAELREKLIAYQREVIEVIDRHFGQPTTTEDFDEKLARAMLANAEQQAKLWRAMLAEIEQRRAVQQSVADVASAVEEHEQMLWGHERWLAELRSLQEEQARTIAQHDQVFRLLPAPSEAAITVEQKAAIKALVDDLVAAAQTKGVRLGQGRNDYPAAWDAFKRQFDLAKYDELPATQFDEALAWLKAWRERIG